MQTGEWDLKALSDNELLRSVVALVGSERQVLARIVAHLVEVEDRRLHLRLGFSSMFDYCLRRLALSEGEAFRRVTAARLARRFPAIFALLAEGDLHLSALCLLRDHLTQDNHRELFEAASRKTKKQVEELLAARFPRPDAGSFIRKLPAPLSVRQVTVAPPQLPAPPSSPAPPTPPARTLVEPRSEGRYRLQVDAGVELKRKLELARDLMSHSNPSGDLAAVLEKGLDLLIEKLSRERFAQTSRARTQTEPRTDRRRFANDVRRRVVERDGLQCSYVSPEGERCTSRRFLQFHHEHAWARGGPSTPENARLLCASHNQLLAERDFGREHVERAIEASKRARGPT
jgi:hypothetical protein